MKRFAFVVWTTVALLVADSGSRAADYQVTEKNDQINIVTPQLEAAVRKKGYVSGVAAQSFLDKKTGFRDPGFGLDIVDWIMEPGSDEAYRDKLDPELVYRFGRSCLPRTPGEAVDRRAADLHPGPRAATRGHPRQATSSPSGSSTSIAPRPPARRPARRGPSSSCFPMGKRYFLSMDRIDAVNSSEAMFLRVDMPGHLATTRGDTFNRIYLSYRGEIPASEFFTDFPPDAKFNYRRDRDGVPERMIRAYQLRDPKTGKTGPVAGRDDARARRSSARPGATSGATSA